jgi:uncharacterized protein (TIGR03085 family)
MTLAKTERAALADLFLTLGPDQPTLDEGWETKDLLIHLLVRENRFDAVLGRFVSPLQGWAEQVEAGYAKRPWSALIDEYRSGPPAWNPMGWGKLDEISNGGEMFIHHEDARRGQPGWKPREYDAATAAELDKMVSSGWTKFMMRKSKVGVLAQLPDRTITLKVGEPAVTLIGAPGEVILWTSGRTAVEVELTGDDQAVASLMELSRGM